MADWVGVGLFAEWVAFEFRDPGTWIPDLVTGWTLMATGLIAWQGRPESRVGILLTASGFMWFVGNFADVGVEWVAWIVAHAVYVHRGTALPRRAHVPSRPCRDAAGASGGRCRLHRCLCHTRGRNESIMIASPVLLVIIAVRRFTIAVARERHARRTAMYVAIALGLVLAGGAVARLAFIGDVAEDASLLGYEAVLCGVAIAMTVALLSRPWGQAAVTDLVVELGAVRSDTLRDSLAEALGDPTLESVPESRCRGVCRRDRPAALAPDLPRRRASTVVEGAGEPVAVLVYDPSLLDDPVLIESIGAAKRAGFRERPPPGRGPSPDRRPDEPRRRIVKAGDEERRRLEAQLQAAQSVVRATGIPAQRGASDCRERPGGRTAR